MSRDGFLPKKLMRISKNKVPDIALACSSTIVIVVVMLLDVEAVAAAADIMFLLLFMLINISVIKIRKDMGDELTYGFLMPFFPYVPIPEKIATRCKKNSCGVEKKSGHSVVYKKVAWQKIIFSYITI